MTETALTGTVVTPTSIAVVVEDDEDARGLAAAIIEDSGLKVIACGNAEDAWSKCASMVLTSPCCSPIWTFRAAWTVKRSPRS